MTYLTYDKQLRAETDPEIIATLLRKGWIEAPQPPYDPATQTCQWVGGAWVVAPIVTPVPTEVSMWALREALEEQDQLTAVDQKIATLPAAQRRKAQNRFSYKPTILRSSQIIAALQVQLGWSDTFVDGLYKRAAAITQEPS
jgi:hypothetical protein